jgi:hypothetical protein
MEGLFHEIPSDPTADSTFVDDDESNGDDDTGYSDDSLQIKQSTELSDITATFVDEDRLGAITGQYNNLSPEERGGFPEAARNRLG